MSRIQSMLLVTRVGLYAMCSGPGFQMQWSSHSLGFHMHSLLAPSRQDPRSPPGPQETGHSFPHFSVPEAVLTDLVPDIASHLLNICALLFNLIFILYLHIVDLQCYVSFRYKVK